MSTKCFKALKSVSRGYGKVRSLITLSADSLTYHNSEHELTISLAPEYSRSLVEFTSLDEYELSGVELSTLDAEVPAGCKPVTVDELQAIAWAGLATDTESTRYALGGVLFDGNNVVGTDGRRMHIATIASEFPSNSGLTAIVPMPAINAIVELSKIFKDKTVWIEFGRNHIRVWGACWYFVSRLVEGRYPNYSQVIPDNSNRERLAVDYATGAKIVLDCAAKIKQTQLENKIALAKCTKAERKTFTPDRSMLELWGVRLDCNYVREALDGCKAFEVTYASRNPYGHPVVISHHNRLAVVMPCKRD